MISKWTTSVQTHVWMRFTQSHRILYAFRTTENNTYWRIHCHISTIFSFWHFSFYIANGMRSFCMDQHIFTLKLSRTRIEYVKRISFQRILQIFRSFLNETVPMTTKKSKTLSDKEMGALCVKYFYCGILRSTRGSMRIFCIAFYGSKIAAINEKVLSSFN